jgi:Uncharacterised nucleotidyltransferase
LPPLQRGPLTRPWASDWAPLFPSIGVATYFVLFGDMDVEAFAPSETDWREELDLLQSQRLSGLALHRIDSLRLSVPADVRKCLQEDTFRWAARSGLVVQRAVACLDALLSAGINVAVSKGPGVSIVDGGANQRPFSDVDVIVNPAQFTEARQLLGRLGYDEDRRSMPPWPWFDRHCREAVNLKSAEGGSVDLHHRISPWLWSQGLSGDRLIQGSTFVRYLHATLPVVARVHNCLIAALHVVSDQGTPGQTLRSWRDVLVLAQGIPPETIVREADRCGLRGWLTWILRSLPQRVQPPALLEALERSDPSLRRARRLRRLVAPGLGSSHLLGQALRLPVPNAALFIGGMVVPSRRFLLEKYDGGAGYRLWWRDIVRGVSANRRPSGNDRARAAALRPSPGPLRRPWLDELACLETLPLSMTSPVNGHAAGSER